MRKNIKRILGFFVVKKIFVFFLIASFLAHEAPVKAQALPVTPVANMVLNRVIAGSITKAAAARGFAANDPRIAATLVGVSSSVSALNVVSTVAGVGLAIAGAPVWLTIAGGLGVFALGAAIIAGTTKLELQQNNLKITTPPFVPPAYVAPDPSTIPNYAFFTLLQTGAKLYQSPDGCFVTQACKFLPQLPPGVEFPITVTYAGRPNSDTYPQVYRYPFDEAHGIYDSRDTEHNDGDAIAVFVSVTDFREHFALANPISPGTQGMMYIPSHQVGKAGQVVEVTHLMPGCCYVVTGSYTDVWQWIDPPVLQVSYTGVKRIFGRQAWHRQCNGERSQELGMAVCGADTWYGVKNDPLDFDFVFASNEAFNPIYASNDPKIGLSPIKKFSISDSFTLEDFADLELAYKSLSSAQKNQPISDAFLASLVDKAWANAASKPGYEGLPYSVTNPVTVSEVHAYTSTQPVVTLNDLLVPASDPGTTIVPVGVAVQPLINTSAPGSNVNVVNTPNVNVVNTPNVNVINDLHVDLGPDPGIGAPGLESTPTAQMILNPLISLLPGLRTYTPPHGNAECPKASADIPLLNKKLTLESHCTLFDSISGGLKVVMDLVWFCVAMFIVLAA